MFAETARTVISVAAVLVAPVRPQHVPCCVDFVLAPATVELMA